MRRWGKSHWDTREERATWMRSMGLVVYAEGSHHGRPCEGILSSEHVMSLTCLITELCVHVALFWWCTPYAATKLSNAFMLSSGKNKSTTPSATLTFLSFFFFCIKVFASCSVFLFLIAHKLSISISSAEICKFSQSCNPSWCITSFPHPLYLCYARNHLLKMFKIALLPA